MKSLFLRIFVSFWAILALILALGIGITVAVTTARLNSLDGVLPSTLAAQARKAAAGGREVLAAWAQDAESAHRTLQVFILDRDGTDLRERSLPVRVQYWVDVELAHEVAAFHGTESGGPDSPSSGQWNHAASTHDSWWSVWPLTVPDGDVYFLIFLPFDSSAYEVLGVSYVPALLLLCALVVSAPLCWAMARHITAPILGVQSGLRALARGDLEVRLGAAFATRSDELGALAGDFDTTARYLQELVSSREALLRNVSHELRSPLTRLQLALALARRQDATQPRQLDQIERECSRLDALIGRILKIARLRSHAPVEQGAVDLNEVMRGLVANATYAVNTQNKKIGWRPLRQQSTVWGSRADLASMLENILLNALRFTPPGGTVSIEMESRDGHAVIEVRDEGPGIDPEHLHKIFEPFFRVGKNQAPDSGTGLGLSIARLVAQQHQGSISAFNRPEGGLAVRITLPVGGLRTSSRR